MARSRIAKLYASVRLKLPLREGIGFGIGLGLGLGFSELRSFAGSSIEEMSSRVAPLLSDLSKIRRKKCLIEIPE